MAAYSGIKNPEARRDVPRTFLPRVIAKMELAILKL